MTKRQTYVPRKPRHQVSDGVDYTVELEFHEDERQSAHLADFSRNGCRLLVESPCFEGQIVTLRLELPQIRQRFELKSTICWTKEIEGQHSVGLVFQEDVPFEILGELILMGVIGEQ